MELKSPCIKYYAGSCTANLIKQKTHKIFCVGFPGYFGFWGSIMQKITKPSRIQRLEGNRLEILVKIQHTNVWICRNQSNVIAEFIIQLT